MKYIMFFVLSFLTQESIGQVTVTVRPTSPAVVIEAKQLQGRINYLIKENNSPITVMWVKITLKDTAHSYNLAYENVYGNSRDNDKTSDNSVGKQTLGILLKIKDKNINQLNILKFIQFAIDDYPALIKNRNDEMKKPLLYRNDWSLSENIFPMFLNKEPTKKQVQDALNYNP